MLEIPLNLGPDASYKQDRFPKILLEKELKFVLNRENSTVVFNLGLMLLPTKINLIAKKHSCKKHAFRACGIGRIEIIFILPTKIVALHI